MGYDVCIVCRDEANHQRLVGFMKANLRPWHVLAEGTSLAQDPDYDNSIDTYVGPEAGVKHPQAWGFHYNSWVPMHLRSYIYALLDWAALRVGKKERVPKLRKHAPFIYYDGLEKLPVLLRSEWADHLLGPDDDLVDEHGFRPARRWWLRHPELDTGPEVDLEKADADLQDRLIKDELTRLSGLWEAL